MVCASWNNVENEVDFTIEIDKQMLIDEVPPNAKILDFGCGYGRIANELSLCGYKDIVGVDPSAKMIERGSLMYPELLLVHVSEGGLPYKKETFDAVVACAVFTCLTSVNDRVEAIAEIHRVLKPSGLFHIVEFCSEQPREFESGYGIPMLYSTPQELRDILRPLVTIHQQVIQAKTIGGNNALCFRALARKSLNKTLQRTSR